MGLKFMILCVHQVVSLHRRLCKSSAASQIAVDSLLAVLGL